MDVQHKQIIMAKSPKIRGEKWSALYEPALRLTSLNSILVFGFVRTESGASGHSVALSGGGR